MRVTDSLAAGVFDASARLELRLPVTWVRVGTTVRARMGLHNSRALPLILHAQVLIHKPWKFTVFLMLHDAHLRRLDVNGSHQTGPASVRLGSSEHTSIAGASLWLMPMRIHLVTYRQSR